MKKYVAIMDPSFESVSAEESDLLNAFLTRQLSDPNRIIIVAPRGVKAIMEFEVPAKPGDPIDMDMTPTQYAADQSARLLAFNLAIGDHVIATHNSPCAGKSGTVVGIDDSDMVKVSQCDFGRYVARIRPSNLRLLKRSAS